MATAAQVANRLRELSGGTLSPLQLLKLTYIAHGWSFPINNEPLLGQRIEAWQYGPVIPDLYYAIRGYRAAPVTGHIPGGEGDLTPSQERLIQAVYSTYGHYSGGQLSALTHQPGTPWDTAWKRGKNSQITDEMVETHYRQLAAQRVAARARTAAGAPANADA